MINENKSFKELIKTLESFGYTSGEGKTRVFEDLINYAVYGFCVNEGLPSWNHTPEQNETFRKMFQLWVLAAQDEIEKSGWCDIPGNIHQCYLYSKTGKGFLGQFFTPENVCTLMTEIAQNNEKKETNTVYDCCCGSGRLLLASFAKACREKRKVYCVAKDIDPICVRMTVANFLMHGVPGEVVWGDGLVPSDGRLCFLTNEKLNDPTSQLFGIPHCRVVPFEETMQGQQAKSLAEKPVIQIPAEFQQLSLW